jgi:hypothetical protein
MEGKPAKLLMITLAYCSTYSLFYKLYIFSLLPYFVWINLICHFSNIVRPRACLVSLSVINMLTADIVYKVTLFPIGSTAGKSTNMPLNVLCHDLCNLEVFFITNSLMVGIATEYTQSGNGRFLTYIPFHSVMEKFAQAGEVGGWTPTPFHSIYHHVQSCSVHFS